MENLSATHAFDYLVFRINPGLTCKDLATVVDNSLEQGWNWVNITDPDSNLGQTWIWLGLIK